MSASAKPRTLKTKMASRKRRSVALDVQEKNTASATKRKRADTMREYNRTRIHLGHAYDRWMALKADIQVEKDFEVATFLIDRSVFNLPSPSGLTLPGLLNS